MTVPADVGTGMSILFGTSGFDAQITSIGWTDYTKETFDVSHLGTTELAAGLVMGSREFITGRLSDPGEFEIEGHFNPDKEPPIEGASETITITFPLDPADATAANYSFTGKMVDFSFNGAVEEVMTFSATVKALGNVTLTESTT